MIYERLNFIFTCVFFLGEASKLVSDYKFKWQKAEQDISTLQANVRYCLIVCIRRTKEIWK